MGGSTGTLSLSKIDDNILYAKRTGWSNETLINLGTYDNTPFILRFEYMELGTSSRIHATQGAIRVGTTNYKSINVVTKTLNQWYIKEVEYTGTQLITREYSLDNTLLGETSSDVNITDTTFIIGVHLGYFGTYDGGGYENKFRNVKLAQ